MGYPLVICYILKMAIEVVDLPIENGDFPVHYVNLYQRVYTTVINPCY
jgi:hypothetical protein